MAGISRLFGALVVALTSVTALAVQTTPRSRAVVTNANEWPSHLHDPGGARYSPLTQITPDNVASLQMAWVYHMKPPAPAGATDEPSRADAPPEAAPAGGRGRGRGSATGY